MATLNTGWKTGQVFRGKESSVYFGRNRRIWPSIFLLAFLFIQSIRAASPDPAKTFTVVTYNVRNLFDLDGVALFDDYRQRAMEPDSGYNRSILLTKLNTITRLLATVNDGAGPEIILFQELEADFTPESVVVDYARFLNQHKNTSIEDMLGDGWSEEFAGYSSTAWLIKALADGGLYGYEAVDVPAKGLDSRIAHSNAVFSRFPIVSVARHPLRQARDILRAELDIDGRPLHVYVNHWKAGASDPRREPVRVDNAKVLRSLLDKHLKREPQADIIVAGDLNSHYNHSLLHPHIQTGINDILGSSGAENFNGNDLYNLWFELPPDKRYSEVWRGRRGTLMHMLLTPGLYDDSGISYVDGSFNTLKIKGLNSDAIGRPLSSIHWGLAGNGASDHFPLIARFKRGPFRPRGPLSRGLDAPTTELRIDYEQAVSEVKLEKGRFLSLLSDSEWNQYIGHIYRVRAVISQENPFRIKIGPKEWPVYIPDQTLRTKLFKLKKGTVVHLLVTPSLYRRSPQIVIEASY